MLGLSACAADRATLPDAQMPAAFTHGAETGPPPAATIAAPDFLDFGSEALRNLLARAEQGSTDIGIAAARIKQADARARQAGAAILPSVDFNPNGVGYAGGAHGHSAHEFDWNAVFSASYELDLWGKLRAERDSATAAAHATRADLIAARVTARAGVANLYFQTQSVRERLALARENLESTENVLAFLEARNRVGLVTPAELASQRALVAVARLAIPELEQQGVEVLAALAVLVGVNPEGFDVTVEPLAELHEPTFSAGLPAELLVRRPDLVAAEDALRSAHADLVAARAAFFPDISLSATGGIANPAVNAAINVLSGTGYSFTLGADIVQSIFDGGRRRAVAAAAAAKEEELLLTYRAAIRAALADVETTQRVDQDANVAQSTRAFDSWNARFHAGAVPYVSVLEAQRTLIAARDQLAQYRLARLQALVNLDKALGGAWSATPEALAAAR